MRYIKKYKKCKWRNVAFAGVMFLLVFSTSVAVWEQEELKKNRQEKNALEEQLEAYRHLVYVATEKLPKGSVLTEDKVFQEIRYSDLPENEFITEEHFGMTLAMDISAGTYLTETMLFDEQKTVREIFLQELKYTEHLKTGDRIDVRIRYINAEDYTVLSDKIVTKAETGSGMLLELTEEEILLLASAVADSKEYDDTWLYAAKYPEYEETGSTKMNYIANRDVLVLLGREKTEGESRTALEKRLMQNQ